MTDGMAIGWPTKSRTRSQIFLHIHRAKEIRIEGEGQRGRKTRAFILMDDGAKVYMKEIQYILEIVLTRDLGKKLLYPSTSR